MTGDKKYTSAVVQIFQTQDIGTIVNIVCPDTSVLEQIKAMVESGRLQATGIDGSIMGAPTLTLFVPTERAEHDRDRGRSKKRITRRKYSH